MMKTQYLLVAFAVVSAVAFGEECGANQECEDAQLSEVQLLQSEVRVEKGQATKVIVAHQDPAEITKVVAHQDPAEALIQTAKNHQAPEPTPLDLAPGETTTPAATGMTMNAEGDLTAFMAALITNCITIVVMFCAFHVLRFRYPMVYSNNVIGKNAFGPQKDLNGFFGWARAGLSTTVEEAAETVGLDQAMMIEFCNLSMKIMAIIGVPMFFIMGPVNWIFGGNAAGLDHMSYLSFGNVENGSKLYWIHALCVWGVVATVQICAYAAQKKFLALRFKWLTHLPTTRSHTILVEGIPEDCRSDAALKAFFQKMLPQGKVKDAYVVKDTDKLLEFVEKEASMKDALHKAECKWKQNGSKEAERPKVRLAMMGTQVDLMEHYTKELKTLKEQIGIAKQQVQSKASAIGGVNMSNGFVTFEKRYDAEICLNLNMTPDNDEWVLSTPPPANDVRWCDLTQDPTKQKMRSLAGYAAVTGLYFAYMPLVIGITNIAKVVDMGPLQPVWAGLAPTMGLQFMVAFLPTFLNMIFDTFFNLKANAYSQHKLQQWYFVFQIVFVVLATAVGQDVNTFMTTLAENPLGIFSVMANTMPYATHFYMNFLVLQWVTHVTNILRMVNLFKFKANLAFFDEEEAKENAEPEDQDYYGIGSRSARWTITMVVGIVYGTLSPPINVLTFINFLICRVVYGYMLPFAETRKPDLGGIFWVDMLKGLFTANIIYCVLMIGVLTERAATYGPMIVASPSIVYVLWSKQRFETQFAWEKLPHTSVIADADAISSGSKKVSKEISVMYIQPELK